MPYFEYGTTEIEYLQRKDKKLGAAISMIGIIKREVQPDFFSALVQSVVSQQISTKAAQTVGDRLCTLLNQNISPQAIANSGLEAIKNCGLSYRKAGYIMGIADAALTGRIDYNALDVLTDEEIIKKLTALNGVGIWTAEMLLIFSLCRPNVVSFGDLAIRRGVMNLYGLKELSKESFTRYRKRYNPYGSVASLYLWKLSAL